MINTSLQSQSLDILAPRPKVRQPPYPTFTPVSPRRNNVPSTQSISSRNNEGQTITSNYSISSSQDDILRTIIQLREPRLPEVPILVLNSSSNSKSYNATQGLLPAFIPAPYELGPNGLTLIVPRRVTSNTRNISSRYNSSLLSSNSR